MDPNFTFPPPQAPTPRPNHPSTNSISSSGAAADRQSNALRASVLDVALELGIGSNSTVTNWMFNNSLSEDDEEDPRSPALTYGSTATSDESSFSTRIPLPPLNTQIPNSNSTILPEGHVHFKKSIDNLPSRSLIDPQTVAPFSDLPPHPPIPPRPVTPVRGKLKKKRADGYESDGGYVSDSVKKKKSWRKKADKEEVMESGALPPSDSKAEKKERVKEAKNRAKEEKLQEKKEKEEERLRKKSLSKVKKATPAEDNDSGAHVAGYETDVTRPKAKKTKAKISDGGYETDSGYISSTSTPTKSKSKSRFFKLGSKQSKPDLHQEDGVPAMPAFPATEKEPPPPLPIASRFATTLNTSPISTTSTTTFPVTGSTAPTISLSPTKKDLAAPSVMTTASSFSATTSSSSNTATPIHSPASPSHTTLPFLNRRASYGSMESGTSSATAKRRGFGFFIAQNQDRGGAESPASQVSSILPTVKKSTTTSSLNSGSPSSTTSKFPAISLPITHTPGSMPSSPLSIEQQSSKQSSPLSTSTSQISLSPGVATSPTSQNTSSPPTTSRSQLLQSAPSQSPPLLRTSPSVTRLRPLNPPTDGFGPRVITRSPSPNLSITPAPALTPGGSATVSTPAFLRRSPSPNPRIPPPLPPQRTPARQHSYPAHLTIAPPSPGALQPPNPNVLAYYDIPPPSPPPTGPLPSVPPPGRSLGVANGQGKGGTVGGGMTRDRSSADGSGSQSSHSSHGGHSQGHLLNVTQGQHVQRGRESPFPSRPVHSPVGGAGAPNGTSTVGAGAGLVSPAQQSTTSSSSSLSGFEARVKVPRYRELYGLALPSTVSGSASASASPSPLVRQQQSLPSLSSHQQQQQPRGREMPSRFGLQQQQHRTSDAFMKVGDRDRDRGSEIAVAVVEPSEAGYDDRLGDGEAQDVRYVLDRFKEAWLRGGNNGDDDIDIDIHHRDDDDDEPDLNHVALRSRLQPHHIDQGTIQRRKNRSLEEGSYYGSTGSGSGSDHYHGTRDSSLDDDAEEYGYEEGSEEQHLAVVGRKSLSTEDESVGDRTSRWSGSIYSRASILDPDKSEETRQRFIKRVEDMYGEGGREKVPPVPKIPDEYVFATTGRSWNRF